MKAIVKKTAPYGKRVFLITWAALSAMLTAGTAKKASGGDLYVEVPAVDKAPTSVTAGAPGSFVGGSGATAIPATLVALTALGALGETTKWAETHYVTLGDASKAYWDGTAWKVGVAPAAVAP